MKPSTITLVKNEDGSHSWKENGVLKQCKYPVQPIFAGNNIIAPQKQCTTQCAMCRIIPKYNPLTLEVIAGIHVIEINCGAQYFQKDINDIEEAAKVISPGKGSLVM